MVGHRCLLRILLLVFAMNAVIQLFAGVTAGLNEDWMRASLFLFGAVLSVFVTTIILLGMGLTDRLARLEDRFHIDRTAIPTGVRRIGAGVGTFMVASTAVHMPLSIFAGFHHEWLRQALHLVACAITIIVCTAVLAFLGLNTRFSRLDRRMTDEVANSPQA